MKTLTPNIVLFESDKEIEENVTPEQLNRLNNEGITTLKIGSIYDQMGVCKVTPQANSRITNPWIGVALKLHVKPENADAISEAKKAPFAISQAQELGVGFIKDEKGKFSPVRTLATPAFSSAFEMRNYKGRIKVTGKETLMVSPYSDPTAPYDPKLVAKDYYTIEVLD